MRLTAIRRAGLDHISHSSQQTRELGAALARRLHAGDLILLSGSVGSGKTTFIQGIASGLGIRDPVTSPTYTLVAEYAGQLGETPVRFYHIDLYRLAEESDELTSFGLEEILEDPGGIAAIEWPQRAVSLLPETWLLVELEPVAETKRRARFIAQGDRYQELIGQFRVEAGRGRG